MGKIQLNTATTEKNKLVDMLCHNYFGKDKLVYHNKIIRMMPPGIMFTNITYYTEIHNNTYYNKSPNNTYYNKSPKDASNMNMQFVAINDNDIVEAEQVDDFYQGIKQQSNEFKLILSKILSYCKSVVDFNYLVPSNEYNLVNNYLDFETAVPSSTVIDFKINNLALVERANTIIKQRIILNSLFNHE